LRTRFPEWLQQRVAVCGQISRKEIVTNIGGVEAFGCGIVMPTGLRVADASVMPRIITGPTNAPTHMIAGRAAKLILGQKQGAV
jgi:hypothetical protein